MCQRLCSRADQRSSQYKRWKSSLVYSCFACNEPANRKFRLCIESRDTGWRIEDEKIGSGLMEWSTTCPPCWLTTSQGFTEVIDYYSGLGNKDHIRKIPEINKISFISRKGTEAWHDKQTNMKKLQCLVPAGQSKP